MINEKGFTLTELIVVVAILGIVSSVAVPNYLNYLYTSRINADISTAREIARSADTYCGTHGISDIPEDFVLTELDISKTPESCDTASPYEFSMVDGVIVVSFTASEKKAGKYAGPYHVSAYGQLPVPQKGGLSGIS